MVISNRVFPPPDPSGPIHTWTTGQKLEAALKRSPSYMPPEAREAFMAMLTPEALGVISGVLAFWGALHFVGWGEFVDVVLLLFGAAALGWNTVTIGKELWDFTSVARSASSAAGLDEAAKHLAKAVTIIGVEVVIGLLVRTGVKRFQALRGTASASKGGGVPGLSSSELAWRQSQIRRLVRGRTRLLGEAGFRAAELRDPIAMEFLKRYKNQPHFANWVDNALARIEVTDPPDLMRKLRIEYANGAAQRVGMSWPAARPRHIDLRQARFGDDSPASPLFRHDPIIAEQRTLLGSSNSKPIPSLYPVNKYDVRVLGLRMGDTITVESHTGQVQTLVLGRFLGGGNSTHIYELVGHPGWVVRLPFSSTVLTAPTRPDLWAHSVGQARWFSRKMIELAPRYEGKTLGESGRAVRIIDHGPRGEYIIAEYVNVVETGDNFLRRVGDLRGDAAHPDPSVRHLFDDLLQAITDARQHGPNPLPNPYAPPLQESPAGPLDSLGRVRRTPPGGGYGAPTPPAENPFYRQNAKDWQRRFPDWLDDARQFAHDGQTWHLLDLE